MTEQHMSRIRATLYQEFEALGLLEDPYNTVPMPTVALPAAPVRRGQLWRFVGWKRAATDEMPTVRMEVVMAR